MSLGHPRDRGGFPPGYNVTTRTGRLAHGNALSSNCSARIATVRWMLDRPTGVRVGPVREPAGEMRLAPTFSLPPMYGSRSGVGTPLGAEHSESKGTWTPCGTGVRNVGHSSVLSPDHQRWVLYASTGQRLLHGSNTLPGRTSLACDELNATLVALIPIALLTTLELRRFG
jgi:hypothetical protein